MAGPFAVEQQVLASIAVFPRVRLHVMPATDQRSIKGLLRTLTDPVRLDALSKSRQMDSVSEKY
jgi:DNA polymerase III delta subunit